VGDWVSISADDDWESIGRLVTPDACESSVGAGSSGGDSSFERSTVAFLFDKMAGGMDSVDGGTSLFDLDFNRFLLRIKIGQESLGPIRLHFFDKILITIEQLELIYPKTD
jgi:hypothetical protein